MRHHLSRQQAEGRFQAFEGFVGVSVEGSVGGPEGPFSVLEGLLAGLLAEYFGQLQPLKHDLQN
jgi:hypothetical protein